MESGLKICVIGTGYGGLCAAIQLQKKLRIEDITIFERNADVGGAWFSNTYPGCSCDIAGHLYSFSFEQKSDWSSVFVPQRETLQYLKSVAEKYGIYPKIQFQTLVKTITWDESEKQWVVLVENLNKQKETEHRFHLVISATGNFHHLNIPEQFTSFKGPIVHTGKWDPEVKVEGKRVAVIGCGASAVQLIPEIVDKAKTLISYQRNPPWVIPRIQLAFPKWLTWTFANVPGIQSLYRAGAFFYQEFLHTGLQHGTIMSPVGNAIVNILTGGLTKLQLWNDSKLKQKLKPKDLFGCRRLTISNSFYSALTKPNVKVVTNKISAVNANSIRTSDGDIQEIDVLILATGFKVQEYFSPMVITGKDSENILTKWKTEGPNGYLGVFFNSLPNMFFISGPGTDNGHNSSVFSIECEMDMIIAVIDKFIKSNSKQVLIKKSATEEYMKIYFKKLEKTVYGQPECQSKSYYYDQKGRLTSVYSGSQTDFWWDTKGIDLNKFNFD